MEFGDPLLPQKVWGDAVLAEDGCWLWTGNHVPAGYGRVSLPGGHVYVHRLSFEAFVRPLLPREEVDHHVCYRPECFLPAHLQGVTHRQNTENRRGPAVSNRSSGVRGVTRDRKLGKWRAQAKKDGRNYYGGQFDTIAEAEAAAIALRNRLFTNNLNDRRATA